MPTSSAIRPIANVTLPSQSIRAGVRIPTSRRLR